MTAALPAGSDSGLRASTRLAMLGLLLAVFCAGLAVATPVPAEDGVSYLWLADCLRAGDIAGVLASPFPPGWPLLLAPAPWFGLTTERWAQVLGSLSLISCLPLSWRIAEQLRAGAGWGAAVLFAASPLLPRLAVEGYSEPPFLLLMAAGSLAGLRQRWGLLGACAGAAFWVRPEGLLLALAFAWRAGRRCPWVLLPPLGAIVALAGWRATVGLGFDPLPLVAFHDSRDDLPGRGDVLRNLVQLPGPYLEAMLLASVLALPALVGRGPTAGRPLALQVWLQFAAICSFVVRRRFFVSAAIAVHALAGVGALALPRRCRQIVLLVALLVGLILAWNGRIAGDRAAERALGSWLQRQIPAGSALLTDLPRVAYFAGQPPPPPRHYDAAAMLAQAAAPTVQFVVLSERSRRGDFARLQQGLAAAFMPLSPPPGLLEAAAARGLVILRRR